MLATPSPIKSSRAPRTSKNSSSPRTRWDTGKQIGKKISAVTSGILLDGASQLRDIASDFVCLRDGGAVGIDHRDYSARGSSLILKCSNDGLRNDIRASYASVL